MSRNSVRLQTMEALKAQLFFRPFLHIEIFSAEYIHTDACFNELKASTSHWCVRWTFSLSSGNNRLGSACVGQQTPLSCSSTFYNRNETMRRDHSFFTSESGSPLIQATISPRIKHNIHTIPSTPPPSMNSQKAAQRLPQAHQENQRGLSVNVAYGSLRSTTNFSQGKPNAIYLVFP